MADVRTGPAEGDTLRRVAHLSLGLLGLYLLGVLIVGLSAGVTNWAFARVVGIALVAGVAMMVAGGLLGFLFGLPRDFAGDARPAAKIGTGGDDGEAEAGEAPARAPGGRWVNNNLIEVSDWLTKIVVGLGLVQFSEIVLWLGQTGELLGLAAGLPIEVASVFGVCVILLNFVLGFLVVYLYSRTLLTVLFATVSRQIDDALARQLGEIKEQQARELGQIKELQAEQRTFTEAVQTEVRRYTEQAGGPVSVLPLLYEPAPEGFRRAEERARELLREPAHATNGRLWGYLACALGQRVRWEAKHGVDRASLDALAQDALTAVEAAIRHDPTTRTWLRSMWDPEDRAHNPVDDDLVVFWRDDAWRADFESALAD